MSARYSLELRCDYRHPDRGTCDAVAVTDDRTRTAPHLRRARVTAGEDGWVCRKSAGSVPYDLCPLHAGDVPGGTFPGWKTAHRAAP